MKLYAYTNEIIDLAKKNNVSWDIGADMFLANIRNAGDKDLPHYEGAKGVDYMGLKVCITELEESKPDFVKAYAKHATEIIGLRKDGDLNAVVKVMEG